MSIYIILVTKVAYRFIAFLDKKLNCQEIPISWSYNYWLLRLVERLRGVKWAKIYYYFFKDLYCSLMNSHDVFSRTIQQTIILWADYAVIDMLEINAHLYLIGK